MSAFGVMRVSDCYPTKSRVKPDHYQCLHCKKELGRNQYCLSDQICAGFSANDEEIWVDYIYHLECYGQSENWHDWHGLSSPEELDGFELLNDTEQQMVTKSLWPDQVPAEMRPKLNLLRCIDDLDGSEVRIELEKRGLKQTFGRYLSIDLAKWGAVKRLERYLDNEDCGNVNDLLVIGYCKGYATANKMNIPAYLQKIVLTFYPTFLYRNGTNSDDV